jgi:light-harvesting complex 1 beta chain
MAQITSLPTNVNAAHDASANGTLFLFSFIVVLCVAVTAQLLFFKWRRWFPGAESERSLIKGVRAGVYTFLSHLN